MKLTPPTLSTAVPTEPRAPVDLASEPAGALQTRCVLASRGVPPETVAAGSGDRYERDGPAVVVQVGERLSTQIPGPEQTALRTLPALARMTSARSRTASSSLAVSRARHCSDSAL